MIAIEHVGSTSVPGLAAKPIIDCDIVVAEQNVEAAADVLVGLGFSPLGELGIPQRWAFKEPVRLAGTNTYVVVDGSLSLRNHLAVRDILRTNPSLRDQYATVKKRVGRKAATIDDYGRGKNAMVQAILAEAGLTDAERASMGDQGPQCCWVLRWCGGCGEGRSQAEGPGAAGWGVQQRRGRAQCPSSLGARRCGRIASRNGG